MGQPVKICGFPDILFKFPLHFLLAFAKISVGKEGDSMKLFNFIYEIRWQQA